MRIAFRIDSSVHMGSGHLMRCLTLAEALRDKGVEIFFICREYPGNLNSLLAQKGFSVAVLSTSTVGGQSSAENNYPWLKMSQVEDAELTIQALNDKKPDWLVVDHYGLDIEWEQRIKRHVEKLMVIDDFTKRDHDCDVLLDQNYSVEGEQRYTGFVPSTCKVLLGPVYALLRKEFKFLRESEGSGSRELEKILVFFTSGDDQGETLKAMQGIELFGKVDRIDVVVGQANPNNEAIKKKCDDHHWGYHCQVDYMPTLIAQADLVIGAGGSSNWERCALGVPALVTILAENQAPIAQDLDSFGVVYNLGWNYNLTPMDYARALDLMDHERLELMSMKSLNLVDAIGAERVASILCSI